VFNTTFSNISTISWRPVLVVEEAGVPGENHHYDFIQFNIHVYIKSLSDYKQNPPDSIFIKASQHLYISY
jgi:hypothetical protein